MKKNSLSRHLKSFQISTCRKKDHSHPIHHLKVFIKTHHIKQFYHHKVEN